MGTRVRMAMVVLVAAVAGACGSSEPGARASGAEQVADQEPAEAPAEPAGEDAAGDPAEVDPASSGDDAGDDPVLTDSFRGVTAESITVGYPTINFEELNQNFGLDLAFANYEPVVVALIDDLNARGGINGRRVDVITKDYIPSDIFAAQAEAICLEFTQDEEVFAILGGFTGPGMESLNDCFADVNETIVVGGRPRADQIERARAPWVSEDMSLERRGPAFVRLLDDAGLLSELGSVVIIGANPEFATVNDLTEEAFEAAGVEVTTNTIVTDSSDENATITETEVILERARADGSRTVLVTGDAPFVYETVLATGDEFTLLYLLGESVNQWVSNPANNLGDESEVIIDYSPSKPDDPALDRCVEVVEAALGVDVRPPEELAAGETDYWAATFNVCMQLAIFEQLAVEAGADLTNQSFGAARDTVDDFRVPGRTFASISSTKADTRDSLTLAQWNNATSRWDELGPETDVTSSPS